MLLKRSPNFDCCSSYQVMASCVSIKASEEKITEKEEVKDYNFWKKSVSFKVEEGLSFIFCRRFNVSFFCHSVAGSSIISTASTSCKSSIMKEAYSFLILI